jgi:hypothetical protein
MATSSKLQSAHSRPQPDSTPTRPRAQTLSATVHHASPGLPPQTPDSPEVSKLPLTQVPSSVPLFVASRPLVLREGVQLNSPLLESKINTGTILIIIRSEDLPDGTSRALIARRTAQDQPLGWVSQITRDGEQYLVPREAAGKLVAIAAKARARAAAARTTAMVSAAHAAACSKHEYYDGRAKHLSPPRPHPVSSPGSISHTLVASRD